MCSSDLDHSVDVTPVYASTSSLVRQIERGAPADIFISANEKWMTGITQSITMSIRLSDMFDLIWKPPRGPPIVKRRPLDKMLPENFKYFRNWGFSIYRTYYGPESDEHWNTLVTILRHQTSLGLGLLESEELREDDDE